MLDAQLAHYDKRVARPQTVSRSGTCAISGSTVPLKRSQDRDIACGTLYGNRIAIQAGSYPVVKRNRGASCSRY